jgi:hypothetical protein
MPNSRDFDHGFTPPGVIKLTPAALQFAREFDESLKNNQPGNWVVVFDWATSISVKSGPDAPAKDIGACVTLGASERHEIPSGFTQIVGGVEYAIQIPRDVWEKSAKRLIDIDESLLFKLALR